MGCAEVKLTGNPWYSNEGDETVQAVRLVAKLFEDLATTGWRLMASLTISQRPIDKVYCLRAMYIFSCRRRAFSYVHVLLRGLPYSH
jgi:hypothetical protein